MRGCWVITGKVIIHPFLLCMSKCLLTDIIMYGTRTVYKHPFSELTQTKQLKDSEEKSAEFVFEPNDL